MSRSNKEEVYKIIKNKIIRQELLPKVTLQEKDMMVEYRIGRTPLRDVFMRLKEDGLIETIPQSGTFVKELDLDELRDAIEMRIPLEVLAAKVIPYRITNMQLEEIGFIIFSLEKHVNNISINEAKIYTERLHDIYYGATCNKKLSQSLTNLHNFSSRAWYLIDFKKEYVANSIKDWKKIESLITNKEVKELQDMMKNHIVSFANTLKLNLEY